MERQSGVLWVRDVLRVVWGILVWGGVVGVGVKNIWFLFEGLR